MRTAASRPSSSAAGVDDDVAAPGVDRLDDLDAGGGQGRGDGVASCRSSVKITARRPGATPYRSTYVAAAPASMIPGRSSSANTIGRSVAPVAMHDPARPDPPGPALGRRASDGAGPR